MKGAPRSDEFDDVYFSETDGLSETEHVFLEGNNLPDAWRGQTSFTIGETGFGTGLNFLAAWRLFEDTAHKSQSLHFISYENRPLDVDEMISMLLPWAEEFGPYLERLRLVYPLLVPGFHRVILGSQVTLTLIFDDVNEAISETEAVVDAWFLDGFKPSTNPDMWSNTVFENMARLSRNGASFATFTAAGMVRRGMEWAGFKVEKVPGYGTKRDMLVGNYASGSVPCTSPFVSGSEEKS